MNGRRFRFTWIGGYVGGALYILFAPYFLPEAKDNWREWCWKIGVQLLMLHTMYAPATVEVSHVDPDGLG